MRDAVDKMEPAMKMDPKYPWLVVQNPEAKDHKIFFPIHDPESQYEFRIPRGRIQGCFHGWVILSNNLNTWCIWNPVSCKVIHLPPLVLKDVESESIVECCLSSPPDDPTSLLLLTVYKKPTFVFCRLDRLEWAEMSYAEELRNMELRHDSFLYYLTCCNGEVYTLISKHSVVILVDIRVVKDEEVIIYLLPMVELPYRFYNHHSSMIHFLKGNCANQMFYVALGFDEAAQISGVYLYKLDMISMTWEELQDLKDAVFFLDPAHKDFVYYHPEIASELGGYIHILGQNGKAMHSLHVKDKTVSLSSMPSCLVSSSRLSLWECTRLPCDGGEIKCRAGSKAVVEAEGNGDIMMLDVSSVNKEEDNESHLLNIPFDVLEMIMGFCGCVEYLKFRATCKTCQLGAPINRWNKGTALSRLQTPWQVVVNHHQGLVTFTDPMFGDNYYIQTPLQVNGHMRILCSRYGWLLMKIFVMYETRLVFFNPFTCDIRELPKVPIHMFCFSAPPTSPECLIVGFGNWSQDVYIHFVAGEPYWRTLLVDAIPYSLRFPTFHGLDLYALCEDGGLVIIREIKDVQDNCWVRVTANPPTSISNCTKCFLVKGDQQLLLVIMGEFGEDLQVFKLNDSTKEWEKLYGLGRHVIYICDTTSIYMEAKTQEMENKIYFPRMHSEIRKMVFYSLETCMYHTSDGENMELNLFETQHSIYAHTWIQPSWS